MTLYKHMMGGVGALLLSQTNDTKWYGARRVWRQSVWYSIYAYSNYPHFARLCRYVQRVQQPNGHRASNQN